MTQRAATGPSLSVPGRVVLGAALLLGLYLARFDPLTVFLYACYAAVGGLLALRRPGNVIGWLVIVIAFGFVATTTAPDLDPAALLAGTATWGDFLLAWELAWSGYATFGGFLALMLVFPSGRLPAGRWHRPAIALLAGCVAVALLSALAPMISFTPVGSTTGVLVPNRFALLPELALWSVIPFDSLITPVLLFLVLGAASLIARYRRTTGIERLQLRWLMAAMTFMVVGIAAGLVTIAVVGDDVGGLAWLPVLFAYPSIPGSIYVAITRYRLYEIDRIISRTLGWVIVTLLLAGVFVVAVVGLQAALTPVTANNTLAVAASTLLVAGLFQQVRGRVQDAVDRRFNRSRVDAQRTVDAFAERLRREVDPMAVEHDFSATVRGSLSPSSSAVWIRGGRAVG